MVQYLTQVESAIGQTEDLGGAPLHCEHSGVGVGTSGSFMTRQIFHSSKFLGDFTRSNADLVL